MGKAKLKSEKAKKANKISLPQIVPSINEDYGVFSNQTFSRKKTRYYQRMSSPFIAQLSVQNDSANISRLERADRRKHAKASYTQRLQHHSKRNLSSGQYQDIKA